MRLKINNFYIYFSYASVALVSIIVISSVYTDYLLCFIAIIIHETGHLIFMFCFDTRPEGIEVRPFDIRIIESKRCYLAFYKDIIITIAGSLFNLVFFIILFFIYRQLAFVNLFMGLFNMLPAASLDGGQLIYLLLSKRYSTAFSEKALDIITVIVAVPVFFFGILMLFYYKYNFSLLFIGLYLVLSLFLKREKYL